VKATNQAIRDFLKEQPRAHFIDVFPKMLGPDGLPLPHIFVEDRLHMNAAGYAIWRDVIGPYLPSASSDASRR
jgi:lysophospholipase L1-like esterase